MPDDTVASNPRTVPWTIVESHLDEVLELDPEARENMLAELGKREPKAAQGVRTLLAEIEALNASGFLVGPFWQAESYPRPLRTSSCRVTTPARLSLQGGVRGWRQANSSALTASSAKSATAA